MKTWKILAALAVGSTGLLVFQATGQNLGPLIAALNLSDIGDADAARVNLNAKINTTIRSVVGVSDTILASDDGKLVRYSNSSPISVTLPQAGSGGHYTAKWQVTLLNTGTGTVTITPTVSTIDGLSSRQLQQYQGLLLTSDGVNYYSSGVAPSLDGSGVVPVAQLPNTARASAVSVPFQGVPTAADTDVYAIPFSVSIAASTVPSVICRVSPAASTTVVVKKWVAGNPATSSTLCTGTISTSCAISSCSISSTSLNAGDGLSVELTAASADTSARISVAVPFVKN